MIRDERRKTKDERYRTQLQESGTENCVVQKIVFLILLLAVCSFAAPKAKSAAAYYGDAAYLYFENRLPSAEIACDEGLEKYPNDSRLQNLKARIQEAKDEQKKENQKNNPDKNQNNENQDQDQNEDQSKDQQNQDKDQSQDNQQNQDQSNDENGSSSSGDDQNQDQQNQNGAGESSSSEGSSDSKGNDQDQQENQQQENAAEEQQPEDPSAMSKAEASQLLKDFDEQNGERKPWKPMRGQAYPEKDW